MILLALGLIILTITFGGLILLIAFDKMERSILALAAAAITFCVIVFIEKGNKSLLIQFLFGSEEDNYLNFHSLLLIFSMMLIVQISVEGGVFQFMAFKLLQMTKGKPQYLLIVFCSLSVFITALLSDILTVMLLLPLTVTVCRILNINPVPYMIAQTIIIKIGASIFIISSIPNILISGYLNVGFNEFFVKIGLIAIGIYAVTIGWFLIIYRKTLTPPRGSLDILLEFNVWNFVPDKSLMFKSIIVLAGVIIGFITIPAERLSPDKIAFLGAVVLSLISRLDLGEIIDKIDFKLVLYLMGIFVLSGGLEYLGLIDILAGNLQASIGQDLLTDVLVVLWTSAILSSVIDNIPVTRILIPLFGDVTQDLSFSDRLTVYSGMVYGINLGDNFTPIGDTMLAINVAKQNKSPIKIGDFFKIGFSTTLFQLIVISLAFCLVLRPLLGLGLIALLFLLLIILRYVVKSPKFKATYEKFLTMVKGKK